MKRKMTVIVMCLLIVGTVLAPLAAQAAQGYEWRKKDGDWYLYEDNKICTGWYKENGKYYYMHVYTGKMYSDKWLYSGPRRYYFKTNGDMAVGWYKIKGYWYYFDSKGQALNGWVRLGEKYYYMQNYKMVTGWHKINGFWYNFSVNGEWMKNVTR